MARMSQRPALADFPKYGYLLEAAGGVVGVILMIHSRDSEEAGAGVRCNLSSWCVDREFRGYALVLHATAVKRKEVTYLNVSPAPHTRRAIEAGRFKRFCDGQIVFAPLLSAARRDISVMAFAADAPESALLSQSEREILTEHAALGCRALVCIRKGVAYPFVFQRRAAFHRLVPCEQLIYCRDMDELVQCAGSIGRHLMFRAWPLFVVDANGPIEGLVGKYFAEYGPKYFKGPVQPRLGDLSYTELVILGP
jgi:hypothetical protein